MRAAADAAAQLVELRQPEALGVLDHHHRRVGHVDADLDHRRRDEDVELAADERAHDAVLGVLLQAAVQQRDAELREDVLRQVIRHLGRGLQIDLLRLLDQRIDDVGLPALLDLACGRTA